MTNQVETLRPKRTMRLAKTTIMTTTTIKPMMMTMRRNSAPTLLSSNERKCTNGSVQRTLASFSGRNEAIQRLLPHGRLVSRSSTIQERASQPVAGLRNCDPAHNLRPKTRMTLIDTKVRWRSNDKRRGRRSFLSEMAPWFLLSFSILLKVPRLP